MNAPMRDVVPEIRLPGVVVRVIEADTVEHAWKIANQHAITDRFAARREAAVREQTRTLTSTGRA